MHPIDKVVVRNRAMKKPTVYEPGMPARIIGRIWDTPVVVVDCSWVPLTQVALWPIMSWRAGRLDPQRGPAERAVIGAVTTLSTLGVEWGHNLAHVAAAHFVGRSMDALRIVFGMPLCVYYDLDPGDVTPRQHILRALGGPIFNVLTATAAGIWRTLSSPGSSGHEVAGTTMGASLLILGAGLLPYPGLDGGPILKWSLVERGRTQEAADRTVQVVDGMVGAGLAAGAVAAGRSGHRWLSGLLALLGLLGLGFAVGLLREG
jgi:Zn-dependent protease